MSQQSCWLNLIVAVCLCAPGCGLVNSAKNVTRESMRSMKPNPNGYRDTTEETEALLNSIGLTNAFWNLHS